MKNVPKKTKTLINIINSCNPDDFLKYRFHDFCQDLIYGNSDLSAYLSIDDFLDIYEKVIETGMLFSDSKDYVDEEDDYEEVCFEDGGLIENGYDEPFFDDQHFYFSFGIYAFKCYAKHCFAVARTTKNDMKKFCDLIDEKYFNENFYKNIIEYYFYFKRDENIDMEKVEIDNMVEAFYFFETMANIDFFYGSSDDDDKEYLKNMGEYIKLNYVCYLESLYLAFANFLNFLDNLMFMDDIGLIDEK